MKKTTTPRAERPWTVEEYADFHRATPATVRRWIAKGHIKAKEFGRRWLIPVSEVYRLALRPPDSQIKAAFESITDEDRVQWDADDDAEAAFYRGTTRQE